MTEGGERKELIPSIGAEMVGSQDPSAAWPGAHQPREEKRRATSVGMTVD